VKVLLDENLDHRLRKSLGFHEVSTVGYMGWNGLKNGRLLKAAKMKTLKFSSPEISRSAMSKT